MTDEKQAVIDIINQKKPEVEDWLHRPAWQDYDSDKSVGYQAWYVDEESGLRSIKSQIVINRPMKEIFDYVINADNKKNYDGSLNSAKEVKRFDDNYGIHYYCYNGTFLIENRDLYTAAYMKYGDDFSEYFGTNFESPKYPPIAKTTRATCIYAGWQFKKQDNGILCTYYTLADMKLNQTLVNTTLGKVAKQVVNLKKILEKK